MNLTQGGLLVRGSHITPQEEAEVEEEDYLLEEEGTQTIEVMVQS